MVSQLSLRIEHQNGKQQQIQFELPIHIGKAASADLQINAWRVAAKHCMIIERHGQLLLQDHGSLGGTWIHNRRISEYTLQEGDSFVVGPVRIHIQALLSGAEQTSQTSQVSPQSEQVIREDPAASDPHPAIPLAVKGIQSEVEQTCTTSVPVSAQTPNQILINLINTGESSPVVLPSTPNWQVHVIPLHNALIRAMDLHRKDYSQANIERLHAEARQHLLRLIQDSAELSANVNHEALIQAVLNEALGLGVLENLLSEPSITEIMVNSNAEIFIEKEGHCQLSPEQFSSDTALRTVIDRIVMPLGRRVDESSPMVDARLADGSRVNVVLPPVALKGPTLTIRKFPQQHWQMQDLIVSQSVSSSMASFLECCVQAKLNILVAGGTGSGKTTLLNILANYIAAHERVITIEDAAELRLLHANLVALEARPANAEGQGEVTIRDLVRNALRMRPDRIVVGECRGGEAFDMLAAMNTGHEGSLTTLHANSPREALNRLETLLLLAGLDLPLAVAREHIATSIQIIVQQRRLSCGRRVISSIAEIAGIEGGQIQLQELFRFCEATQSFQATGIFPQSFEAQAQNVSASWFAVA